MDHVSDLQAFLQAEGLVDGATGWVSIRGPFTDSQDRMVSIIEDGGMIPEIAAASGIGDSAFRDPAVQVSIRAERRNRDAARAKAEAIFAAVHSKLDETMGATTYLRVMARSEPTAFQDESERPVVSQSYLMMSAVSL